MVNKRKKIIIMLLILIGGIFIFFKKVRKIKNKKPNKSSILNKRRKIIFIVILILFGFGIFFWGKINKTEDKKPKENIVSNEEEKTVINAEKSNEEIARLEKKEKDEEEKLLDKFLIDVPFTSQAPFAKWDELHEEACEEASIIMLKYFLDKKELTPQIAEKEIQNLIKFQIKNYGEYKDSNAEQTARLYFDFYGQPNNGIKLKVFYDFRKEDLKKYLSRGYPIIIPAAGRLLKNPNFTPPGPFYHNLVLIGYDGNKIITNDPGTRNGKSYKYDIDVLYRAIHDFTGKKEDIEKGQRAMIVLE